MLTIRTSQLSVFRDRSPTTPGPVVAMPVTSMKQALPHAIAGGTGVAAFNPVDRNSARARVDAAAARDAPATLRTSVKTVKHWGNAVCAGWAKELAADTFAYSDAQRCRVKSGRWRFAQRLEVRNNAARDNLAVRCGSPVLSRAIPPPTRIRSAGRTVRRSRSDRRPRA